MKKLEQLFDSRLEQCLNDYSDTGKDAGTNLRQTINNAMTAEMIVPVLGTQGMGKSTLINALLKENILPNGADETTCVPVEVKYGEANYAKVHFFDSSNREDLIVHTREELNQFVDNNFNPANEKRVAVIELYRSVDWIKNGLTIVDLPGVGSLTKENEETTKKYIMNLCSAIFVIPTVPTIRNKEALFIKSLWSQFSKAVFVQNDWGESPTEMAESVDFNNKILSKIAKELHNTFDNEILVVNAYNGVYGALHNDEAMVSSSNINKLRGKIEEFTQNWGQDIKDNISSRIASSIEYAICWLHKRIEDQKKSAEEVRAENERIFNEFKKGTAKIESKIDEIKHFLRKKEDDVYNVAKTKSRECTASIRREVFRVIDAGVYDGENLSEAFEDIQEEEIKKTSDEIMHVFMDIKFEVEKEFEVLQAIQLENSKIFVSEVFSKEEQFKWEKGVPLAMSIGGGIAASCGAAPLLAALGFSGPPGWVVAGIGLAICAVFSWVGNKVKKTEQADRANESKREISNVIDDMEHALKREITNKFEELRSSCFESLDKIFKERKEEEQQLAKSYFSEQKDVDIAKYNGKIDYNGEIDYLSTKLKAFGNEKQ